MKVISRNSKLALVQVDECFALYPQLTYELVSVASFGDKRKDISLLENPPADIFTRELDEAILSGTADVAVHSAKDLPYPLPQGLEVIALLKEFDQTDSLVSKTDQLLSELPTGSKVGTSSPTRKKELLALRPDLQVVSIRGTIEERIALVDNGQIDALIVATCALYRLKLSHRIAQVLPFETHPLQGLLAVVAASERADLKADFNAHDICKTYGKVTLVGFGPGSPDLLTFGGEKAIAKADTIFYDDLLDKDFLQKYSAKLVYVGKRKGKHSSKQAEINRLLLDEAKTGRNVVRLKGGDPMIFAHGGEEIEFLKSNFIEVSVIPGITTALALASLTQVPLTHRGIASSVAFVSGQAAEIKLPTTDTVVCYMAGYNIPLIATKAIAEGRNPETPVLLVSKVSSPEQQEFFYTLETLSRETKSFPTPIISIIGDVVGLRYHSEQELIKPAYLVTGTQKEHYDKIGTVIHQPLIRIEAISPNPALELEINRLNTYDWLFFTSRYTVNFFFEALEKAGKDARHLAGLKIASVGRITSQELKLHGIIPEIQAVEESSVGLLKQIEAAGYPVAKVFIPRSDIGLPVLPEGLKKLGWEVSTVSVYHNTYPENLKPLDLTTIPNIVFSSPSCVTNFLRLYGSFPEGKNYIFRGKETEKRFNEIPLTPEGNKTDKNE